MPTTTTTIITTLTNMKIFLMIRVLMKMMTETYLIFKTPSSITLIKIKTGRTGGKRRGGNYKQHGKFKH
jgi:hypothetical protein